MEKLLTLSVPGYGDVAAPEGIPSDVPFDGLIGFALNAVMLAGIILALIYLVYGGLFWIQASGDKTKWDKARRIILYSVIGLIIMSLALVVVNVVLSALGVNTIKLTK